MQPGTWSCISCPGSLVGDATGWVCAACGRRYPAVAGTPILVGDPAGHLAGAYLDLHELVGALDKRTAALGQAIELGSPAAEDHARARRALAANAAHLRGLAESIAPHVPLGRAVAAAASPRVASSYADPTRYARRDWSGEPAFEAELAHVRQAVARARAPVGTTLVLGAACGRIACEAPGARVVAVDASPAMAMTFERLRRGDLRLYEVGETGTGSRAGRVAELSAVGLLTSLPGAARVEYAVADARALPLPARSVSLVIAAFFTDVVPLRELLREVTRVLTPGGVYVHYGPLQYHFDSPDQARTPDEVRRTFAEFGFTVGDESWHDAVHLVAPEPFRQLVFTHWTFVARLGAPPRALTSASVLGRSGNLVLESRVLVGDHGETVLEATLRGNAGEYATKDRAVLELVRRLDGQTQLGELFDAVEAHGHAIPDRAALLAVLGELRALGFVSAR